jgi:NAD(P)-dependent dehydrogenase (short-subunit alcohol dehydrogenase family)
MKIDLHNRRALVTGSTGGIGFAITRELAAAGVAVVVNGRTQAAVDRAMSQLRNDIPGASVNGIAADASSAEGCNALIAAEPEIDILVNNVGIFKVQSFFDIEDADWLRMFETNVLSGIRLSRHYAPRMRERGWGRVIFISSESALNIPKDMVHYGMTKAAQLAVSRGLAEEMAGSAMTVNAVLPGPTRSEGVETFLEQTAQQQGKTRAEIEAEFFRTARPTSLIQRFAEPREVANLVVYLASPAASATTGAAVRVDGGVISYIV